MNFLIYRQSSKTLNDEIVIYSGEDARPYADENMMLVADGLGGTGAMRHKKIVDEMFDEETIVQALFRDMYTDEEEDEAFTKYVKDSFVELYPLKGKYRDNLYTLKKSSYFGSRIVCSALLHQFRHNSELSTDKIFDDFNACEDEEQKQKFLEELGKKITDIIKNDIAKIAENANIIYETTMRGSFKLLATTLCATIFRESEEKVEAIYFIIGDSNPYVWNEKDGLSQVIEDQESADGAMNGCINVGGDFSVQCKHSVFEKPCVLFNASDGAFESGLFVSPMAFEKLILDAVISGNSVEEVENKLISDYNTYGTHDDSSTIAMRCFGYDSFEKFKEACVARSEDIKKNYLDKMEGLLETNYAVECQNSPNTFLSKIAELREKITNDENVKAYCEKCVLNKAYPEAYSGTERMGLYSDDIKSINEEIDNKAKEVEASQKKIKELISENVSETGILPERSLYRIKKTKENYNKANTAKNIFELFIKNCEDTIVMLVQTTLNKMEADGSDIREACKELLAELECAKTESNKFIVFIKQFKEYRIDKLKIDDDEDEYNYDFEDDEDEDENAVKYDDDCKNILKLRDDTEAEMKYIEITISQHLNKIFDLIEEISNDLGRIQTSKELNYSLSSKLQEKLTDFNKYTDSLKTDKIEFITGMKFEYEEYLQENKALASEHSKQVEDLINDIVAEESDIPKINFVENVTEQLSNEVRNLNEAARVIEKSKNDIDKILLDAVSQMLRNDFANIFSIIVKENILTNDLQKEAQKAIEEHAKSTSEIEEKAKLQTEIFESYDKQYRKYM